MTAYELAAAIERARAARVALDEVRATQIDGDTACAMLVDHLRTEHKWTIFDSELTDRLCLKSMHVVAHSNAYGDAQDELGFAVADHAHELIPDPYDQAAADRAGGPYPDEDPAYIEWCERERNLCRADFLTGPAHDPYSTSCDRGAGHYPHTDHEGGDPFGMPGRVSWRGGGSCAGDPLRQTDILWTRPEGSETA